MTRDDDVDRIHGSGNVFRDLGLPNPEVEQLKAILATKIIGVLDDQKLTVRRAHEVTGFAAADFSRVRQAKLSRFTVDRLMSMLDRLDQDVEVTVSVQRRFPKNSRAATRRLSDDLRLRPRIGGRPGRRSRIGDGVRRSRDPSMKIPSRRHGALRHERFERPARRRLRIVGPHVRATHVARGGGRGICCKRAYEKGGSLCVISSSGCTGRVARSSPCRCVCRADQSLFLKTPSWSALRGLQRRSVRSRLQSRNLR